MGVLCWPLFVIQYCVSFLFCNDINREERAGYITLIVFLISCDCLCSVALKITHGVVH